MIIAALLLPIALALPSSSTTLSTSNPVNDHSWVRPTLADQFVLRSACPMMNALANHGYLPRDGGEMERHQVVKVLESVVNCMPDLSNKILDNVFAMGLGDNDTMTFNLGMVNQHNKIEHDVSVVHDDFFIHNDVVTTNQVLVTKLASFATGQNSDGLPLLLPSDLVNFLKTRLVDSRARNPTLTLGDSQKFFIQVEASLLFLSMGEGASNNHGIKIGNLVDFLGLEKLPENYQKPRDSLSLSALQATIAEYFIEIASF